jgi:CheY-like chemotaxis protein
MGSANKQRKLALKLFTGTSAFSVKRCRDWSHIIFTATGVQCNSGLVGLVISQSLICVCRRDTVKKESNAASGEIRILVAEDFLDWRIRIRSILEAVPEWKIVFEASDGAEAVEKAAELLPDIVLLDIGLPRLNGIEAAKQIQQYSPDSKIIFVTSDGDRDVRKSAMETGAEGYVLKADAERELVPAIAAALHDSPSALSV